MCMMLVAQGGGEELKGEVHKMREVVTASNAQAYTTALSPLHAVLSVALLVDPQGHSTHWRCWPEPPVDETNQPIGQISAVKQHREAAGTKVG